MQVFDERSEEKRKEGIWVERRADLRAAVAVVLERVLIRGEIL